MNGIELKEKRKIRGYTQQQLADLIGVSLKTITNYEKGEVIPFSKHAILHKVLSSEEVKEPDELYFINSKDCEEKLKNLTKEIQLKDEIIILLKDQINLIKLNNKEI
jgi:transcriptional regulator with XRE-family HTH domain